MLNWLTQNYIEVLGAVTGLIYLYFSYNRNIWLWPFGIITSALYVLVFFGTRLYADMSLQLYYVFVSIYGWYFWLKGESKGSKEQETGIVRLNLRMWLILTAVTAMLSFITGYLLSVFTNASLPYLDAFTTAGGIVATWMLARKILENWLFWIVIDLVASGMYLYKEKYPTLILYLVYTIIAVAGYYKWKREAER